MQEYSPLVKRQLHIKPLGIKVFKAVIWLFTSCLAILLVILVLVLEMENRTAEPKPLSAQEAKEASVFLTQLSKTLINAQTQVALKSTEKQINTSLQLIHNTYSDITGNVNVHDQQATFQLSLRVHWFGVQRFINTKATLLPHKDGLQWTNGKIGKLTLNDSMSSTVFQRTIQVFLGKQYGKSIVHALSDIEIQHQTLALMFTPPQNFRDGFAKAVQCISSYSGKTIHFDTVRIQHYLDFLVDLTRSLPQQNISLSHYLHTLMKEAQDQTEQHQYLATQENSAAIFALAIQIAPGTFRHFISNLKVKRLNATAKPKLTLSGRNDLAIHFIYSAALQVLANKGVSFSIGEIKEFVDTTTSGFSFADIAADKSGIRFTEAAINKKEHAILLHKYCSNGLLESDFFPSLRNLPEGLNEHEFNTRFKNSHSHEYNALLKNIDTRIENANLFYSLTE